MKPKSNVQCTLQLSSVSVVSVMNYVVFINSIFLRCLKFLNYTFVCTVVIASYMFEREVCAVVFSIRL